MNETDDGDDGLPQSVRVFSQRKKKNSAFAVYDEDARKEFLTGFRKRKQERRRKAADENKKKLKQQKALDKQLKKQTLSETIGAVVAAYNDGLNSHDDEEDSAEHKENKNQRHKEHQSKVEERTIEEKVYKSPTGSVVTTTVSEYNFDEPENKKTMMKQKKRKLEDEAVKGSDNGTQRPSHWKKPRVARKHKKFIFSMTKARKLKKQKRKPSS